MRILLHYLLVFVIAVLPLQGGAIAAMPAGAGMVEAHHAHMAMQSDAGPADMADMAGMAECCQEGDQIAQAGSAHAKCNSSANCCVGAVAPPNALAGLSDHFTSLSAWSSREPAMTIFVPPTLERPPRLAC